MGGNNGFPPSDLFFGDKIIMNKILEKRLVPLNNIDDLLAQLNKYGVAFEVEYSFFIYTLNFTLNNKPMKITGCCEACANYLRGMLTVYNSWMGG